MISRADLFGDPVRQAGQISPRGDQVAFLAPRDGVINLWVLPVDAIEDARPLTDERARGVSSFVWAQDNASLLYFVDSLGDGRMRLFAVNAAGSAPPRALAPEDTHVEILGVSADDANGVVATLRGRDQAYADVVRIDLASGERELVYRNTGAYTRFLVDRDNLLRLGVRSLPGGSQQVDAREGRSWRALFTIDFQDTLASRLVAFEAGGRSFLMFDSTDRDRTALVRVDADTGVKTVVGESARADVVDVWLDPATNVPEAFATEYLRREWRAIDPEAQADLEYLDGQLSGDFNVVSRNSADTRWIVEEGAPAIPTRSYLYDRPGRRLSLLFRNRPALEQAALQPMTPVEIEARDGLTLVTYLTLPIGSDADRDARPDRPTPLVLTPHDGPWARDSFGFNPLHQWLANRGYAVLSVNFRGSVGFSKAFLNAGNREWGGRMQDDLLDAVQWAVQNGVARPDRIAVVGAGFGGYAALSGLSSAPAQFRCGASFGGVGNLVGMIEASSAGEREALYQRVGDPRTAEGRQMLRDRSPVFRAVQIEGPLLLALGARDTRASRADADQIAQSLRARRVNLTYLLFPQEGGELVRSQNRLSYLAVLEHFLGDCLGGRVEPVGASFEGADIDVFDGAVNVPGLSAFARRIAPARQAASVPETAGENANAEDVHAAPLAIEPVSPTPD